MRDCLVRAVPHLPCLVAMSLGVLSAASGCTTPVARCVPGEARDCTCSGGGAGAQICADDGERYGACTCVVVDAGTPDATSELDASVPSDAGGPDAPPVSCATLGTSLPPGWSRGILTQFTELPWIEIAGTLCNPFPNCGGTARILSSDAEYHAIAFDTPSDVADWLSRAPSRRFSWDRSQVGGEADIVYVSVTTCPGDFRIPPSDVTAPVGDPTFARGCRNVRRSGALESTFRSEITYVISEEPATETVCHLAPGRRYYLNFIRADATDGEIGTPDTESVCVNPDLTTCGVQMRIE